MRHEIACDAIVRTVKQNVHCRFLVLSNKSERSRTACLTKQPKRSKSVCRRLSYRQSKRIDNTNCAKRVSEHAAGHGNRMGEIAAITGLHSSLATDQGQPAPPFQRGKNVF